MKVVFLMVARVLYDKGYQEFVDAARIVRESFEDVEFQLLGGIDEDQPSRVPISVILADHNAGIINYLGFTKDVRPLMRVADCVVLPSSYYEGMSRVLMEALALRKPIITTTVPGCQETVEDCVNGFLVPPKDAISLADACRSFLAMSLEQRIIMGEASRRKAEAEFDVKDVISVYKSITDKVLSKRE